MTTTILVPTTEKRAGWRSAIELVGIRIFWCKDSRLEKKNGYNRIFRELSCSEERIQDMAGSRFYKDVIENLPVSVSVLHSLLSSIQIILSLREGKDNRTLTLYSICLETISFPNVSNGCVELSWMDTTL